MRSDSVTIAPPAGLPVAAPAPARLWPAFVALVGAAAAMSVSPTLVRLADVGPFASAFWRVALALPVLWLWMRQAESSQQGGSSARFSRATLLAGLAFSGDLFFWHLSIVRTTVANATFFATAAPLWVVLFGWLILGRRVGRPVLVGLACCILGGAMLVSQSFAFNPGRVLGDAFGIATGIFFGLYFLAVGAARGKSSAARVTFELSLITTALLLAVALVFEPNLLPRSSTGWAILFALALVSHVGGQGLLSVALGRLPAVFSSLVIFLEAIVAALVAWVVLGEPVTLLQALGGIVIVSGIWIARPREPDGG